MHIEKLTGKDLAPCSRIATEIIATTDYYSDQTKRSEMKKFSILSLKNNLDDPNIVFLVAKEKERIIGFCSGNFDCETFWIDWVGILREWRRKMIATHLLLHLEDLVKKNGVHKLWCDTRTTNKESISLHQKLGFTQIAALKKHWYQQDFYLWEKWI